MAKTSRTQQELNKLPQKQLDYLIYLRDNMRRFYNEDNLKVGNECRHAARGYIKCLEDCGVASFNILWAWFTL